MATWAERFSSFFRSELAERALSSVSDGAEIEFQVQDEVFTLQRLAGRNSVRPGAARKADLWFGFGPKAAESFLTHSFADIGSAGVHVARLMLSSEPDSKVTLRIRAGVLTLMSRGYWGVLTAGGSTFASFLASHGLQGLGAIKTVLTKLKS